MDERAERTAKRPYETPTLVPSSVFGAEAATGSCCRSPAVCNNSMRDSQIALVDPAKVKNFTAS